jgi:hypothetical protein
MARTVNQSRSSLVGSGLVCVNSLRPAGQHAEGRLGARLIFDSVFGKPHWLRRSSRDNSTLKATGRSRSMGRRITRFIERRSAGHFELRARSQYFIHRWRPSVGDFWIAFLEKELPRGLSFAPSDQTLIKMDPIEIKELKHPASHVALGQQGRSEGRDGMAAFGSVSS